MSTWTSRRLAGAALVVTLAACVPQSETVTRLPVLGGAAVVRAPAGYCIDTGAGRETADQAVVLMGRCDRAGTVPPAIITVTLGPDGSARAMAGGGAALARYMTSPEGLAALSRDGRATAISVREARSVGDTFILRLEEPGTGSYWRAVLALRGRLATVTVTGDAATLPVADGRTLLDATLAALRAANR